MATHCHPYLADDAVVREIELFFYLKATAELHRSGSITEREPKRANRVHCYPLNFRDPQITQQRLLFKLLQVLVLQSVELGPF